MKTDLVVQTIRAFAGRKLLVDTNLLLLYFIGGFRRDLIRTFSRTARFTEADFLLLAQVMHHFRSITTTPHVLTEVSNMFGQHHEPERSALLRFLGSSVEKWNESRLPARHLVRAEHFPKLGLTDTAIMDVSGKSHLVLTDDRALAGFMKRRGKPVLQFEDLQAVAL